MKKFIDSELYFAACQAIVKATKIKIFPIYSDALVALDNNKIEIARLTIEQIENLLGHYFNEIVKFSILKLQKYDGLIIEQDYPSGEELDEDNRDSNEVSKGYSKGFLLINLIEFYILKNAPNFLVNYLKAIRIPKPEKYANEIKSLFAQSESPLA